jgi:hypothetical protein
MAVAAPLPVFWAFNEATCDGIAMEVFELLDVLVMSKDVEVVVAGLPELAMIAFEELGGFRFEDVERCRQGVSSGFGEEQVNVLGHEDVAEDVELVALAKSFEDFFEDDPGGVLIEIGEPTITTEGDEVVGAFRLVAL